MVEIRPYTAGDLEDLYRVCLATGSAGSDASGIYKDPKLVGHIYAAPYGVLRPECALVVEDEAGVGGYVLGAPDTLAFEAELEARWWPPLRARYPDPRNVPPSERTPDQRLSHVIHHPHRTTQALAERFPAHLHIDLVPRLQGRGLGRAAMDRWLALAEGLGARGAHLEVGTSNHRAVRFYQAYGLAEQTAWSNESVHVFATTLPRTPGDDRAAAAGRPAPL